jgi:hypothetical protein
LVRLPDNGVPSLKTESAPDRSTVRVVR